MADERIDVEVADKVNASIAVKIRAIGDNANQAASNLDKLTAALAKLDSRKVDALTTAQGKYSAQLAKDAIAQERVSQGYLKTEESLNRAIIAENKAAQSAAALSASNAKAATAQNSLATSAEKLTQAQNATAVSAGKVTAQNNLTAASQQKLQQAQNATATTAARLQQAQNGATASLLRVSQQSNQTATSSVKLQTANNQLVISSNNVSKAQSALQGQLARTTASQNAAVTSAIKLQQAQLRLQQQQSKASGGGLGSGGSGLAALAGTVVSTKEILDNVNAYQSLENRLRTVTSSEEERIKVQQRLTDISNKTYVSLDASVILYQRLKVSADRFGFSGEQVYQVITNLNKAFALSGATAEETRGAIIQLSQAVGGNFKTSAQELNTVLEQAPGVAKVLAEQLGTTTDQLKAAAKAGEISTKDFFKALSDGGKGIAELTERFARIKPTITNASIVFKNNIQNFVGGLGEASGATDLLAKSILFLSEHMEAIGFVAGIAFPILVAGLASSTIAQVAFNKAVLANPYVLAGSIFVGAIVALGALAQKSEAAAQVFKNLDAAATNFVYRVVTGFAKVLSGVDRVIDGWHVLANVMGDKTIYLPSTLGPDMQKYADKIQDAASKGKGLGESMIGAAKNTMQLADASEEADDWFKKVRTDGTAAGEANADAFKKATYEINRATVALQEYDRQLPGGAKIISVYPQLGGVDSRDITGVYGNGTSSNATGGGTTSYAGGGAVHGPGGPRDDIIPAMLSAGEFVVNADATSKHRALLEAINTSPIRHYADGGYVGLPGLDYLDVVDRGAQQEAADIGSQISKLRQQLEASKNDDALARVQGRDQSFQWDWRTNNFQSSQTLALEAQIDQLGSEYWKAARAAEPKGPAETGRQFKFQLGGSELSNIEASGFDPYIGLNGSSGGYAFSGNYSQEIIDSFRQQRDTITQWNTDLTDWWNKSSAKLPGGVRGIVEHMYEVWKHGNTQYKIDPRPYVSGPPLGVMANKAFGHYTYQYEDLRNLIAQNGYLTSVLAGSPVWGSTVGKYVQYAGPQFGGTVNYGGDNPGPVDYSIKPVPVPKTGSVRASDLQGFFGGPRSSIGFRDGGSFMVGGDGGPDSQLVQFMASPDERVTVATPQQQQASSSINIPINLNVSGADPRQWKASEGQVIASLARKVKEELRNQGVNI
jgi:tape measure domain-containing protein